MKRLYKIIPGGKELVPSIDGVVEDAEFNGDSPRGERLQFRLEEGNTQFYLYMSQVLYNGTKVIVYSKDIGNQGKNPITVQGLQILDENGEERMRICAATGYLFRD
tara:strand:- start:68 stop:385 length:318 start_codon:yes stop_codon:yes gene_type:complete